MAQGLPAPSITQVEFASEDHQLAQTIAQRLGYQQYAYTSTSGLWGLFCLAENPEYCKGSQRCTSHAHPPFTAGVIIKTREFGLLFVQDLEDLRMGMGVIK